MHNLLMFKDTNFLLEFYCTGGVYAEFLLSKIVMVILIRILIYE